MAFTYDDIVGIQRVTWGDIKTPTYTSKQSIVTGNVIYDERIILLLDFEKIVSDIDANIWSVEEVEAIDRSKVKLIIADDSALIREVLKDTLTSVGYENMKFFNNGKEALNYLLGLAEERGKEFKQEVHLMVTDIEMPQMDGHTLTRKVKEHAILKDLPVVIFSSLITDDLKHKGVAVGADAQMSKPEIGGLVKVIDELTGGNR